MFGYSMYSLSICIANGFEMVHPCLHWCPMQGIFDVLFQSICRMFLKRLRILSVCERSC